MALKGSFQPKPVILFYDSRSQGFWSGWRIIESQNSLWKALRKHRPAWIKSESYWTGQAARIWDLQETSALGGWQLGSCQDAQGHLKLLWTPLVGNWTSNIYGRESAAPRDKSMCLIVAIQKAASGTSPQPSATQPTDLWSFCSSFSLQLSLLLRNGCLN